MRMRILVTGSKGQLGSELKELSVHYRNFMFFFTDVDELDICNKRAVEEFVDSNYIEAIINCAAYTAVDRAECEPELADRINHLAVRNLAEISRKNRIRLTHISTDYVFDGEGYKPYTPNHPTEPVNVYGTTKLRGEKTLKEINPSNSMIIRTSWVYSSYGNNFVKTMLKLGEERNELNVINDQVGVPTYARDLAKVILDKTLSSNCEKVVIYHYTNEGVCSWYDFAKEVMELGKKDCQVSPIASAAYPTPAKRPFYSLLDKSNLKKDHEVEIPYWKDSLRECIAKILTAH